VGGLVSRCGRQAICTEPSEVITVRKRLGSKLARASDETKS
jgi:hypothetical protein